MERSTSVDNMSKQRREQLKAGILEARKAVEEEHARAWKMMKTLAKLKQDEPTKTIQKSEALTLAGCHSVNPPFSHITDASRTYDPHRRSYSYRPFKFNHRTDPIKFYNEEMYKLRTFAPQPRKDVPKLAK